MPEPDEAGTAAGAAFEQVLERALHSGQVKEALERSGGTPARERLRAQALQARAAIAAAAGVDHRAGADRDTCRFLSVRAMLVPGVPAVTAAFFLVLGFSMCTLDGRPYIGEGLITAGLIVGAMAAGAAVGDAAWFLTAGARDRADADVRAREAWELALLERGMVPFLLSRLDEPRTPERGR
ncbi:hypothetical protein ABZ848_15995 [Streptomyces sp. NPDC047081]|uniref:hypothetical protein n=1 Tax=Streptomyces sp. NPDC047081 TaxID=3154706 RepID=UPI0033D8732D